jgi:hypothetical protein
MAQTYVGQNFNPTSMPSAAMQQPETALQNLQRNVEEMQRVVVRVEALADRFVGTIPQEVYSKGDAGGTLNTPPVITVLLAHGNQIESLMHRANAALSRIETQF